MPNYKNNVDSYCLTATAGTKNLLEFYLKNKSIFYFNNKLYRFTFITNFFSRDQAVNLLIVYYSKLQAYKKA